MNILLLLLAIALKTTLSPFLVLYGIAKGIYTGVKIGFKENGFWGIFSGPYVAMYEWIGEVTISIDQMGNVLGRDLWNDVFRKPGGYDAGDRLDTISYFIGANEKKGTLTKAGRVMAKILNKLDAGHTKHAYEIGNERLKTKLFKLP
jgi:hypothetical protein